MKRTNIHFFIVFINICSNIGSLFAFVNNNNEIELQSRTIHCPDHFTAVGDTCYYLSSSAVYLNVANHTCLSMKGFLVSIETPEENTRLYEWLLQNYDWPEWFLGPYIGLYRYNTESDQFQWVNPASRWSSYRNWEGGAPSIVAGTDNCVIMTNIQATWYNYYCDAMLQFVCEAYPVTPSPTQQPVFAPTVRPTHEPTLRPSAIPTTLTPTMVEHPSHKKKSTHAPTITTYQCPDGYTSIHSTCYSFASTPAAFKEANKTCASRNGWLVTIESEIEDQALILWLQSIPGLVSSHDGSGPFIGLYRESASTDFTASSFHWMTHPTKNTHASSYSQWALNYPLFDQSSSSSSSSSKNCVVISMESGWMNVDCSSSHQYICETIMIPTQSTGKPTDDLDNIQEKESMLWSLLVPFTLLAGGLLFFCCMKLKSRQQKPPGPDHQYLPQEESEHVASTHSLVQNHIPNSSNNSTQNQNGKYLSKYNSSPEETMEIQLQMRSYAPLTQNSV